MDSHLRRFEFYGRKLKFVYLRQDRGSGDPAVQRADAQSCASQNGFASDWYDTGNGYHYHEEAARQKVISVAAWQPQERKYLEARRPYLWQYPMAADDMFASFGDWICKRLAGRRATHAGSNNAEDMSGRQRAFGVILQTTVAEDNTDSKALEAQLKGCGHTAKAVVRNGVGSGLDPVRAANVIIQMKEADVTSVVCLCYLLATGTLHRAASNQAYYPEWLLSSYGLNDNNAALRIAGAVPEQLARSFGVSFLPPQLSPEREPYWWAQREVDPTAQQERDATGILNNYYYHSMLLLASGIQMAGPNLTAASFEAGLHRATFPNPNHSNRPGAVGFQKGSYAMTTDGVEFWWSNDEPSPYPADAPGTFCYVDNGARRVQGQWPTSGDPFFSGACTAEPT